MHTNDPLDNAVQHRPPSQVDEFGNVKPQPHPTFKIDAEHPGYETTDVNTNGVVYFLGGLVAFLIVFFFLCFFMGKAINYGLIKQDVGEKATDPHAYGYTEPSADKRVNLANNPSQQQQEAARIARSFPTPQLDADDGNQGTSDLHAKEDLLLEHNSVAADGTVRIPINRAMELIAQKGLGTVTAETAQAQTQLMAGERETKVHAPLTNGFARTAYEIDQMESREQKMTLEHPEEHKK